MIIGLVLLGCVVLLLFFGIAERVFKSFGVAYWLAFLMVGVLIGCAFIPSIVIGAVTIDVAGFIAPLVFAVAFFVLACRSREGMRALVAMSAVAALFVAVRLLIDPIASDIVSALILGFLCGATAYLVAKTKVSALAALFGGFPLGEGIAALVGFLTAGTPVMLGSAALYDSVILASVLSVALYETVAAIKRTMNNRAKVMAETANEFDPDEYKRYFDE